MVECGQLPLNKLKPKPKKAVAPRFSAVADRLISLPLQCTQRALLGIE